MGLLERMRRSGARSKEQAELRFWRGRHEAEGGTLNNVGFEDFYCERFGLSRSFYEGKRVLDVGCGPRGTLEWAGVTAERVGLDPLVDRYRDLGIDRHAMRYVQAPAELMPFEDGHFDVVSTLNSLDHVDDVDAAVREVARVTAAGGLWLLVVEAEQSPTATEPQTIPWDFVDHLEGWRVELSRRVALDDGHDIHGSWGRGIEWAGGPGLIVARLRRL